MSLTTPAFDLADLAGRLRGTLAAAGEPGYELAVPFNVAVPVQPLAVVAVADAADVAHTVRFAGEHGLRVVAQRTGHGAVAVGDDVLLVHTGRLDEVAVDPATRIARVGAGAVWQQVLDAATPHGLAPSMGSSPTIGVAGFLTGGGIGPLVRNHGLGSDRVRAFEVVTGAGEQLRVTATEHPELFWALRGGKGTVGVVCAIELELLELETLHGGALIFDTGDVADVLRFWRGWALALPEGIDTSVALMQLPDLPTVPPPLAGKLTLAVRFASLGSDEDAAALLAPLRAVATPLMDTVGRMPYAAIAAIHMDPTDPMPVMEASALLRELPEEAMEALLAATGPDSGSPQIIVEVRLLGGALAAEGRQSDAFCHRDAAFTLLAIGVDVPPIAEGVAAHGAALIAAFEPWATGGVMPNFAPAADPERMARVYDEDTRAWLAALGERHDPAGVLRAGRVAR